MLRPRRRAPVRFWPLVTGAVGYLWRLRWPLSVRILIGVGVLFALQAFPLTGVFLMLVAAPVWSAPLVNLAVVVAGVEGAIGRAPRWFLLVPLCWFGLYAVAVAREEAALARATTAITEANAASVAIPFDPTGYDVVTDAFVDALLVTHRLPVVYREQSRGRDKALIASRLTSGAVCDRHTSRKGALEVQVRKLFSSRARGRGGDAAAGMCIVSFPEEPRQRVVRVVTSRKRAERIEGLRSRVFDVTAEADGRQARARAASAQLLHRWPLPVMGCGLNSGAPSWDCSAGFWRRPSILLGHRSEADALAAVLDTSRLAGSDIGVAEADVLARLAEAESAQNRRHETDLEAFLADPKAFPPRHELFRGFEHTPEKLTSFAGRLLDALEAADAEERRTGKSARLTAGGLARLVAQLPDADIVRNGPRILALLDGPIRGWRWEASSLVRRTSSLGEAALPVLMERLKGAVPDRAYSPPDGHSLVALCRMGPPAAAVAGPVLLELWRQRNAPRPRMVGKGPDRREVLEPPSLTSEDRLLYLALLRLGLRDEAGRAEPKGKPRWWTMAWDTVTPQSPVEVCEKHRSLS